jgi:hypothetical protein
MKTSPITPLLLGLLVLSSCGGGGGAGQDGGTGNPRVLYLALDGSETRLRLSDAEPSPF